MARDYWGRLVVLVEVFAYCTVCGREWYGERRNIPRICVCGGTIEIERGY